MTHPARFLTSTIPLSAKQWQQLRDNCTSQTPGPGPDKTTFHFEAVSINDVYDRTIVADVDTNTFTCLPQPHCACQMPPLDCECIETTCHLCKHPFVANTNACTDLLCVQETCPLCQHQREVCAADQIRQDIVEEYGKNCRDHPGGHQAQAYVSAISTVLAPGVGDAPSSPSQPASSTNSWANRTTTPGPVPTAPSSSRPTWAGSSTSPSQPLTGRTLTRNIGAQDSIATTGALPAKSNGTKCTMTTEKNVHPGRSPCCQTRTQ